MAGQRNYKRRRIWINASFQARYTAIIVGVALSILAALGFLYLNTLGEQQRLMGVNQGQQDDPVILDSDDEEFNRDLADEVGTDNLKRTLILAVIAALMVAALAYFSVRLTFRAAGPVFAVSQMLKSLASGNYRSVRKLRKGDEFLFLQDDVFALKEALAEQSEADGNLLRRAIEAMRSLEVTGDKASIGELIADLEKAKAAKDATIAG